MKNETTSTQGGTRRALRVLSALADAGGALSIREAAKHLSIAPSTTHRLLNLLREEGFAAYEADTRTYSIGPEFYRIAARVGSRIGPVHLAEPLLERLAAQYDETILFGLYLPTQNAMSFAARADGTKKLLYHIEMNTPVSLLWGASGKVILASLSKEKVAEILEHETVSPASGARVPALSTLERKLVPIRKVGYAISHGEKLPGACGIAAPVFGPGGVIGSLCLTSPDSRLEESRHVPIGEAMAEAAATLSRQLGAPAS